MDHLRAATDRLTAVGPTGVWMQGPRISWDDLVEGSGQIQHLAPAELFKEGRSPEPAAQPKQSSAPPKAATPKVALMMFGKHKGRPMSEVQEMDPGYWRWLLENVSGFEKKARAAGLLDE